MQNKKSIKDLILSMLYEYDIIDNSVGTNIFDHDFLEMGIVDSMGLISLQAAIEETFSLTIPEELFIGELRTIKSIISYIDKQIPAT